MTSIKAGRSKSPSRRSARSTAPPVAFVAGPASRTAGTKHESGGSGGSGADNNKRQAATAALFETPAAAALALALVGGFCIGLVAVAAQAPGASVAEALLTSLWFVAITLQFTWVLAPWHAAPFARRWTYATTLPIFLLPHLPICKRGAGKAVGAAQGAAALVLIVRSFSMLHRMEEEEEAEAAEAAEAAAEGREKGGGGGAGRGGGGSSGAARWSSRWGRWRRVYQGMALGWHDVDEQCVRVLAPGAEHAAATRALAAELARIVVFMAGSASLMSVLPPPGAAATAAGGGGGGGGVADAALAARIALGGCSTVAGFHLFDSAWRLLMCRVNRLSVDSILGGSLWRSESVRELWLAWNLPVQRLLLRGVYLPLRRRRRRHGHAGGRVLAQLATFALSGCCHLWPCFCAGLAWEQLGCMLLFFLAQPALVAAEGALGLRGRVWAIGVELCLMPLFVLPVLKFTDPQMTMAQQ